METIISYDIIGWDGTFDNFKSQLRICQKLIVRILLNKEQIYSIKNVYNKINIQHIKHIYLKLTAIYLKTHNMLHQIIHGINTRYANNSFIIKICDLFRPHLVDILK